MNSFFPAFEDRDIHAPLFSGAINCDSLQTAHACQERYVGSMIHRKAGQPSFMLEAKTVEERNPPFRWYLDVADLGLRNRVNFAYRPALIR
jgi:hypothetical protein